ncbi:MAG: hypothetical protein A2000_06035 [Ignavibacteria bacterium GWB2_36_8]|nr:MAG: hypothetical protein A2000_06035 [Ignavibacteria bacterium GWB2_36_8]OGU52632.1 MAG: hypothetical protein A2080_01835 [Ignavibacteria bacterium GWC2_36_12]
MNLGSENSRIKIYLTRSGIAVPAFVFQTSAGKLGCGLAATPLGNCNFPFIKNKSDGAVNTVLKLANKSISPWQGEMTI